MPEAAHYGGASELRTDATIEIRTTRREAEVTLASFGCPRGDGP
jgi:hypothetical protein